MKKRHPWAPHIRIPSDEIPQWTWVDCSSADRLPLYRDAAFKNDLLLLADMNQRRFTVEPLPNFDDAAPHVMTSSLFPNYQ